MGAGRCSGSVSSRRFQCQASAVSGRIEGRVTLRKRPAELENEIQNLQASEERRGSSASQSNGCCFAPAILEQFLTMGAAQAMQQLAYIHGEVSKVYDGQHRPEPTAPEREAGAEEKEAWEEEWGDERMANGWYESAACGSAVDPAEGSDDVGGSSRARGKPDPRGGKRQGKR